MRDLAETPTCYSQKPLLVHLINLRASLFVRNGSVRGVEVEYSDLVVVWAEDVERAGEDSSQVVCLMVSLLLRRDFGVDGGITDA